MDRDALITNNIKIVYKVIHKFKLSNELEDYVDLGIIGLIKGIDSYDKTKGFALSTYVYRCVYNEILMYLRKKRIRCVSLDKDIRTIDDEELTGYDVVVDSETNVEETVIKRDKNEQLSKCVSLLEKDEQYIINSLYGINGTKKKTQQELGNEMGLSQAQVSGVKTDIIEKLKIICESEEINK